MISRDEIDLILKLKDDILTHSVSFVRHLTTVGATLLAVLIVIPAERRQDNLFLTWALFLLLASVLSGIVYQWSNVKVLRTLEKQLSERIKHQFQTGSPRFEPVFVKRSKALIYSERLAYLLFALSMICLAVASFY